MVAIERELKRGDFVFRYVEDDDFGAPAERIRRLLVLADRRAGRDRPPRRGARAVRAPAAHAATATACSPSTCDPATGEAWGNFVQTYSMVGLITSAIRLSMPWDDAF